MRALRLVLAVSAAHAVLAAQPTVALRIEVVVNGPAAQPVPVPQHTLLVSDNPATAPPRRVMTGPDGTLEVRLRPGTYIVESDQPVVLAGRAYQWTELVELRRDVTIRLTEANAEIAQPVSVPGGNALAAGASTTSLLMQWQDGMAAIWTPTARLSAFLVDAAGLLVTSRTGMSDGSGVDVQVEAPTLVPGQVIVSDAAAVAVVRVSPSIVSGRPVLPLECPPPKATALDEGDELAAIAWSLRRLPDVTWGTVTGLGARVVDADLRVPYGGAGGPVFNRTAALVGVTVPAADREARPGDVNLVRLAAICDAVATARVRIAGREPPPATARAATPARPFPVDSLNEGRASAPATAPPTMASSDFDIALLTPPIIHAARQRGNRTGRTGMRDPEAELRLGLVTDFGAWSDYFGDLPAVLAIRVTPKLVEGFWKKLARGAALTQGAVLPAFKDFKTDFVRLQAWCGDVEVVPVHPLVLEHRVSERDIVREGLYIFDPGAIGPHCSGVTLTLYSGKAPARGETVRVPPAMVDRIWQDFEPWRAGGPAP